MFLTPHSRFITNAGIEIPCSDIFITKFKTYARNETSYIKDGIQDTVQPEKFSWSENIDIIIDASKNVSFNPLSWVRAV